MSVSEKTLMEWHLRQSGALPESCTERVSRVCLECGTIVANLRAWQSCGRRCEACEGTQFRDECVRCQGACVDLRDGRRRSCASVTVFRATGRVAFPEKVGGPPGRPTQDFGRRPNPVPDAVPSSPVPDPGDLWGRVGWRLGTVVGTAAGLCKRWLDGLMIR